MMTIIKLVTALEQCGDKVLRINALIPSLNLTFDRNLVGSSFNSTKAILMLISNNCLPLHIGNNTSRTLLPQLKTFTDEEGEDDPPGEICWDKEVLLSHGESYGGDNSTTFYFPIDAIEITENTFKLIAGNELLELRTIEVNGVATRNGIVC